MNVDKAVYVVIVEDRHTDDSISLFTSKAKALRYAREKAAEAAKHYEAKPDEELTTGMMNAGWLFWSSIEDGGAVRVETKRLIE